MSVWVGNAEAPTGVIADWVNVYGRSDPDEPWRLLRKADPDEEFEVELVEDGVLEVAAAFVVGGIEQSEPHWVAVCIRPASTSDLTAPDAVADFSAAQEASDVILQWTASEHPFLSHYEIGMGATEEARIVLGKVDAKATTARFGVWAPGSTTYWIQAITEQDQRSAGASATVTLVAEHNMPVQGTHNEHSGGYSGTKSGTEDDGSGNLQIESTPGAASSITVPASSFPYPLWGDHIGEGTYTTAWQDVGAVVDEAVEVAITPTLVKSTPAASRIPVPARPRFASDGAPLTIGTRGVLQHVAANGTLVTGITVKVEIDTAQDGGPTPDGWRVWIPGKRYRYRQVRLRITLMLPWRFCNVRLTAFTWKRRRRNRKDEGSVTVSSTGGTTVTFTEPFTVAPVVQASVYETTLGVQARVSNVTASGCEVRLFNWMTGVELSSGDVHWSAQGV